MRRSALLDFMDEQLDIVRRQSYNMKHDRMYIHTIQKYLCYIYVYLRIQCMRT